MVAQSLSAYIEELRVLEGLSGVAGKPQNLQIVGGQLYWLQGINQVLYTVSLADPTATPRCVVPQQEGVDKNTNSEFCPDSKEEELLRERRRTRVTGITSYHVRPTDGAIFFSCGTNTFFYHPSRSSLPLNIFDFVGEEARQRCFGQVRKSILCFQHVQSFKGNGEAENVSNVVTFVHESNLCMATIVEHDAGQESPLDLQVETVTNFGDKLHECGTADYIMQEEFDRYTGHYATERYILFSYTDTSMLKEISLINSGDCSGVEKMSYCRVGDPNARILLVVYELETKRYRFVPLNAVSAVAPWIEYVPRFGFKNEETIYFSLLSRTQERSCVLSCRIDSLPVVEVTDLASYFNTDARLDESAASTTAVQFTIEWEQHIPWAWVEVQPGPPIIFRPTYDVILRHADESSTAHAHIYVRAHGSGKDAWQPLTEGEWNVKRGSVRVLQDCLIFLANANNRLENALYSVPLTTKTGPMNAAQITRLSPPGEHVYSFTAKNDTLCYVSGKATEGAQLYIASLQNPSSRHLVCTRLSNGEKGEGDAALLAREKFVVPSIITTISRRGVPLSGRFFPSPMATPGTPNPVAIYVYGGPHVQLVYENDYDGAMKPLFQLLARSGISVLVADAQMSDANGLRHLSICKHNMGNFETSDYVDFVRHMTASTDLPGGFVADPARIAIWGWSYGGYATLLAMSQAPDIFKIGYAGAPVGDWTLYDTGYTERYMGELYTNPSDDAERGKIISAAYTRSAIKNFALTFPDDINRVFIAHGLLDENVHFSHTSAIVTAMVDAGKPYSIVVYPGERHSLQQKKASHLHHDAMVTKTFVQLL